MKTITLDSNADRAVWRREINPENVNDIEAGSGWTRLHYAARIGDVSLVAALIEAGADINYQATAFKVTPLHLSIYPVLYGGTKEGEHAKSVIVALLEAGANTELQDSDGRKPVELRFHELDQESQDAVKAIFESFSERQHFEQAISKTKEKKNKIKI